MAVLSWLALMAWASITFLASAATGSTTAAAGMGFVALVVVSLASIVPALGQLLPTGLSAPAIELATGTGVTDPAAAVTSVVGTVVLIGAAVLGAQLAFRAREPERIDRPRRAGIENGALHGRRIGVTWPASRPGGQARADRSRRRWKRSTWPAVSMMFCLPV